MPRGVVPPVPPFAPSMLGHANQVVFPGRMSGNESGSMPARLSGPSTWQLKDSRSASSLLSGIPGSAVYGPSIDRQGVSCNLQPCMANNGGWSPPVCKNGFPPGLERPPVSDIIYGRSQWSTRSPLDTRSG
jgi:hypothetical protein